MDSWFSAGDSVWKGCCLVEGSGSLMVGLVDLQQSPVLSTFHLPTVIQCDQLLHIPTATANFPGLKCEPFFREWLRLGILTAARRETNTAVRSAALPIIRVVTENGNCTFAKTITQRRLSKTSKGESVYVFVFTFINIRSLH